MGSISLRGTNARCTSGCEHKDFYRVASALKEYEFAAGYCVEMYEDPTKYPNGTQDENYYCEIWIPVVQK